MGYHPTSILHMAHHHHPIPSHLNSPTPTIFSPSCSTLDMSVFQSSDVIAVNSPPCTTTARTSDSGICRHDHRHRSPNISTKYDPYDHYTREETRSSIQLRVASFLLDCTCSLGIFLWAASRSRVGLVTSPIFLAIEVAVTGWSPVTMTTFIPAV